MKNRNRTAKLVIALASFSLVAAACGSDNNSSSPAASDAMSAPATDAMSAPATDAMSAPATDAMTAPATDAMGSSSSGAMMAPSGPLCSAVPADGAGSFKGMAQDTAATAASNNPVLSTLVAAVKAAGLVDTLNSDGPFTIFAPANAAFDALPAGTLDSVLANKDQLTSILTLHVIAGEKLSSADLIKKGSAKTVNGEEITFTKAADGSIMVNGQATVGCADIQTANATVHVIDAVLMP